jgi:dTDP-4-amino-4,6-dideoxygalactose transaminase
VIEDACHALGAKYKGHKIGSCRYSDMTILSFHPVKHITTGEGGAVLTNKKEYYDKLIMFRSHGITKDKSRFRNYESRFAGDWYYEMHYLGYNYRMTDIQAALGISQLKKLDSFVQQRRSIAGFYDNAFTDNPYFDIPTEKTYACSSFHLYPIRLNDKYRDKRKAIFALLRENGIGVQVQYIPVHLQPYYKALGYREGSCPVSEEFYQREISLPVYPAMTETQRKFVVRKLLNILKGLKT